MAHLLEVRERMAYGGSDSLDPRIRKLRRSKSVDEFAGAAFDAVITVCDAAAAACPSWPGARAAMHWSVPDPAAIRDVARRRRLRLGGDRVARPDSRVAGGG